MHTNNTSHYNLPQFIGSDIPNPLTDFNDSMQAIDTAMYEIKTQADEIGADVVEDESDISDLQSQANLTDDNITLLNQQTTAARTATTDAQDAANRNAANITTLQQSVANNRTSITQYNNRFNQNVPFAFGIEEVEDPDNPGQTIEKYGFYTNDDPSDFVPFGETSAKIAYGIGFKNGVDPTGFTFSIKDSDNNIDDYFTYSSGNDEYTCIKKCDIDVIISASANQSGSAPIGRCAKNSNEILTVSNNSINSTSVSMDVNDTLKISCTTNSHGGATTYVVFVH